MKNIYLVLLIFILSSCSSGSGDGTAVTSNSLLGRWQIVSSMRGTFPQTLTQCSVDNDFFTFKSNQTSIYEVGNVDSQSNCNHKTYDQTFALNDSILITKTIVDGDLLEFHYRVLTANTTTLKLQLFYTKGIVNGQNVETVFMPEELETATYMKIY